MRKERRWIKSVLKEAARTEVAMPWARGARRTAFIAKRTAPTNIAKAARA